MMAALYTALTGMNTARQRAAVAARNIVNAASAGSDPNGAPLASETLAGTRAYQPQRFDAQSLPGGGVRGKTTPLDPATYPVYDPTNPSADANGLVQYPNVSLVTEFAQLTLAVNSYKANAKILKTVDETMGTLLDSKT